MDCAVLILSRPLYISVPIWEFCLSFPVGVTWKWSAENELGDFEIYNNLSQWRNVLPFCSSITCKNIGFMSRQSKKENQTELGALKILIKNRKKDLAATSYLHYCNIRLLSNPPEFGVCVRALIFQVFTTCAQLRNLIWMLLRIHFYYIIFWIALKHTITLFIGQYMIQWAEKIFLLFLSYFTPACVILQKIFSEKHIIKMQQPYG